MKIHPTAIVHPAAEIAEDVEIGPYAIIDADATIGAGTIIQSHVVIEGRVELGRENTIGHGSVIGAPPQDLAFQAGTISGVRVGDRNVLREYCTIHRGSGEGSETAVGDQNFLMVGTHVGHNCAIGNGVTIANNSLLAGHVRIDDQAFIGGGTTFHQHTRVGRFVMAQGMSGFGKDIPPFLLAAGRNLVVGVNVIGLRRGGFGAAERDEIKRAFKLLYRSGFNTKQALAAAATAEFGPLGREFFRFVGEARKRGIAPYRRASED